MRIGIAACLRNRCLRVRISPLAPKFRLATVSVVFAFVLRISPGSGSRLRCQMRKGQEQHWVGPFVGERLTNGAHSFLGLCFREFSPQKRTSRSSSRLMKKRDVPESPCRPARPRSWLAATLHPDLRRGPCSPLLFTPSRRPPGATCVPRPRGRAALPSRRRWICTPSASRR